MSAINHNTAFGADACSAIARREVGVPADRTPRGPGVVLTGFVERVGDPVPLVAADGSSYPAERLLVEALDAMVDARRWPSPRSPSPCPRTGARRPCGRCAMRFATNPILAPHGVPARLVSDAVASLTALNAKPGLPPDGVVALLDFGGGGTSVTLADAAATFDADRETPRYPEFSGDQIDQALLTHVLDGIADCGDVDPAAPRRSGRWPGCASSAATPRSGCRRRRSPSWSSSCPAIGRHPVTRAELESLIARPLDGVAGRAGKYVGAQQN